MKLIRRNKQYMKRIVLLLGVTALLTACGGGGSSKVGKF